MLGPPKITIQDKVIKALERYPTKALTAGEIKNIPWISSLSQRSLAQALLKLTQKGRVQRIPIGESAHYHYILKPKNKNL